MKTFTLHSNNSKAIFEAAQLLKESGFAVIHTSRWYFSPLVAVSCGDRVSEDAANDYRFHQTVAAAG